MTTADVPGLVPPDLARLRSFTRHWRSWQGLTSVIMGIWVLAHADRSWLGTIVTLSLALSLFAVRGYYKRALGFLQVDQEEQTRGVKIVLAVFVIFFVALALHITYDFPTFPKSAFPLMLAVSLVVMWATTGRGHTDLLVGAAGLAAWWAAGLVGPPIPQRLADTVTDVLAGCILILHGLRTHFTLMRFVRSMQARAGVGAR